MNISSKIILGFVFIASAVFMYMAARTLKTHEYWRNQYNQTEQQIEQVQRDIDSAQYGRVRFLEDAIEVEQEGIRQLRITGHELVSRRGRVWEDVRFYDQAAGANQPPVSADGKVNVLIHPVNIHTPVVPGDERRAVTLPQDMQVDQMVYLFDTASREEGGRFLGIFKVTEKQFDQQNSLYLVELTPTLKDTPTRAAARRALVQKLQDASRSDNVELQIYDTMPRDRRDLFANLSEQELSEYFPAALVPRYLESEDRPILDFEALMVRINAEEAQLDNDVDIRKTDLENLKTGVTKQQAILAARRSEAEVLSQQIAAVTQEVRAVEQLHEQLTQEVQQTEATIETTFERNRQLVERLAQIQEEALERAREQSEDTPAGAQTTAVPADARRQ